MLVSSHIHYAMVHLHMYADTWPMFVVSALDMAAVAQADEWQEDLVHGPGHVGESRPVQ